MRRIIDPGFRKLVELKPSLNAIYTNSSQCAQLFEQGGTWIAPWYSGRVASTRRAGVPVAAAATKEGAPVYLTMLCPLKGKWNPWVARFMNMHLSVATQQAFAKKFASGPSREDVKLDPEVAKTVPYGQNQVSQLIQFDWDEIIPHLATGSAGAAGFLADALAGYRGSPATHELYKLIVEAVLEGDPVLGAVEVALISTSVVSGEFGMVEAYKRKKAEFQPWLADSRPRVKAYAATHDRMLDRMIATEQRRSEEDLEARKRRCGDSTGQAGDPTAG